MFMESFLLVLLYVVGFGKGASDHTLVMVSHRGGSLDIRHVPSMMVQAAAAAGERTRFLSQDDLELEQCLAQTGMVHDLSSLGVQIVDSKCALSHKQIMDYFEKAEDSLDIEVFCEADFDFSIAPVFEEASVMQSRVSTCTGGNRVLGTNDPGSSCQGNLEVMRMGAAWQTARAANRTLRRIVLAILDTGVDMTHPDLVNQFWKNPSDGSIGHNFITNSADVTDDNGHGTHCAGAAGAQTNNGIGIAGVADVELMILKFMDSSGEGSLRNALKALDYAVRMGATVSSHSYFSPHFSRIFQRAIRNAADLGHIVVAAAGNDDLNLDEFPAYPCSYAPSIPSLLCVAASTSTTASPVSIASFSNIGSAVNIVAPGVNILSTYLLGSYAYLSGTSMATPQVAGVAALLAALGLGGQRITDSITRSRTATLSNRLNLNNLGELDALNAVNIGLGQPTSPPTPPSSARFSTLISAWSLGLLFVITERFAF